MKSKEVLENQESKQNDKKIKTTQKYFEGVFLGPQTPLILPFLGKLGGPKTPPKIFFGLFSSRN